MSDQPVPAQGVVHAALVGRAGDVVGDGADLLGGETSPLVMPRSLTSVPSTSRNTALRSMRLLLCQNPARAVESALSGATRQHVGVTAVYVVGTKLAPLVRITSAYQSKDFFL
jgi:hypothetical protein